MSKDFSEKIKELIKNFISDSLDKSIFNTSDINQKYKDLSYKDLKIKVSFGLGVPAKVSWMAFLGSDQEVSKGIYSVILFDREDCLVLAYGVSESENPGIDWPKEIKNKYPKIKDSSCNCNLSKIKGKYPNSYLRRCFKLENRNISEEKLEELISDLDEIIDVYKNIFNKEYKSTNIQNFSLKQRNKDFQANKKIEGLYFVDNNNAIKNTEEMIAHLKNKPCTLYFWWHQKPEGRDETLEALRKKLEKDGYFYIFAIQKGKCVGRYKVQDFFVLKDPYSDELPKNWKNCAIAEIWFDSEKRKETVEKWMEEHGKKGGTPKVVFKITEVKKLNSEALKKGKKAQIIPFYKQEKICNDENCFENSNLKLEPHITSSFYNSLKTKGFVILAGLSGTGKTKIFEEFVKCFPEKNNLFFPIRPDFKDTKSLLGFYNPLKEQYHSTPLLDFVLNASKNYLEKGNEADPFFVLFDEMNLARVEYYFADFLSVLESKTFENKDKILEMRNMEQ